MGDHASGLKRAEERRDQGTAQTSAPSLTEQLAQYFRAHPNEWIDGRALEFAGRYAWRSRVSELRRAPWHMTIDNRQRKHRPHDFAKPYTISEYRYSSQNPRLF